MPNPRQHDDYADGAPATVYPDLNVVSAARDALQKALLAIKAQLGDLTPRQEHLKARREKEIKRVVADLLPGFQASTLRDLNATCPAFVDAVVLAAFEAYRPWLGFIDRPGSAQALGSLQTRLAFYFDTKAELSSLSIIDKELAAVNAQIDELQRQDSNTADFIELLKHTEQDGCAIPEDVYEQLKTIVRQARQLQERRKTILSDRHMQEMEREWRSRQTHYRDAPYQDAYAWYCIDHHFHPAAFDRLETAMVRANPSYVPMRRRHMYYESSYRHHDHQHQDNHNTYNTYNNYNNDNFAAAAAYSSQYNPSASSPVDLTQVPGYPNNRTDDRTDGGADDMTDTSSASNRSDDSQTVFSTTAGSYGGGRDDIATDDSLGAYS
ncbi:hypothetical protein [Undibacterium sp. TJN19]|uniref:hypothetical protein n=1 Tax=Undibacterium sp. TJN19 TaxID=3413055 RepID=UPI003BF44E5E